MPKFEVRIERLATYRETADIEIEADDAKQAREKALNLSGPELEVELWDGDFVEGEIVGVESVEEITDDEELPR